MVDSAAWLETKPEVNSSAGLLAVQRGEFGLQRVVHRAGAADVAGAAGAGAHGARGLAGGLHHDGMAAHGEVVVGRPDQHLGAVGAAVIGKAVGLLLQRR